MNVFPEQTLSEPDMIVVSECLSNPAVKKYMHALAYGIGKDIVTGTPHPGQSPEEYLRLEAGLKGQLAVLDTLLSIEPMIIKTQ